MSNTIKQNNFQNLLKGVLERELGEFYAEEVSITDLKVEQSEYRTSFAISDLSVRLSDGKKIKLLYKNLSWQLLSSYVKNVKPKFLYNPIREIEVYRGVLSKRKLGSAIYYGSEINQQKDVYWLFVEKVKGLELYQFGDIKDWCEVARYLAKFHFEFSKHVKQLGRNKNLVVYDRKYFKLWAERACDNLRRIKSKKASQLANEIAKKNSRVVSELLNLPQSFIHGEFYASNVLVQTEKKKGKRVCPVDWEMAGVGPAFIDLAALVSGKWTEEQKLEMALAYYRVYKRLNKKVLSREEFLNTLDFCRLHIAVQWLGWSSEWKPPKENSFDWMEEARRMFEKISDGK